MKRVNKGEKYYTIIIDSDGVSIEWHYDWRELQDDTRYTSGNYYAKSEEAEKMANKLRLVLDGTEIIESSKAVLAFNDILAKLKDDGIISYDKGCEYMKEFQSKIVK